MSVLHKSWPLPPSFYPIKFIVKLFLFKFMVMFNWYPGYPFSTNILVIYTIFIKCYKYWSPLQNLLHILHPGQIKNFNAFSKLFYFSSISNNYPDLLLLLSSYNNKYATFLKQGTNIVNMHTTKFKPTIFFNL